MYGIRSNMFSFFENYLNQQKQYVFHKYASSKIATIACRICPQGSALGPTLFSLYINDLVHSSDFLARSFADDTILILSDSSLSKLERKVNLEIKKVATWLNENKSSRNYIKTTYISIYDN